jgi:hypothetical protein
MELSRALASEVSPDLTIDRLATCHADSASTDSRQLVCRLESNDASGVAGRAFHKFVGLLPWQFPSEPEA